MGAHTLTQFSKSITELNAKISALESSLKAEIVQRNNTDELKATLLAELQTPRSVIKSVQRGVMSMGNNETRGYSYISAVDTSKSILNFVGNSGPRGSDNSHSSVYGQLSGGIVYFYRQTTGSEGIGRISWEVIEYV